MDILILMIPVLIIVAFYYAVYKVIKYIFSDLLDVYFTKKHQYEQAKDNDTETEFYKTAADIESHLKNEQTSKPLTQQSFEEWKAEKRKRDQGGFVNLDAPIRLPWRRTV